MKRKYFYKILILYSFITFVLTMGFFFIYYKELQSEYRKTFREQNDSFFSAYVEKNEEMAATLVEMASYIKVADTLGPFADSGSSDYYPNLTALFQELSAVSSGNRSWRCDYFVHKIKDDTCVTNTSTSSLAYALKNIELSEDQYNQVLSGFSANDLDNAYFIVTDHRFIFTSTRSFGTNQVVITVALKLQNAGQEENGESFFADFFVTDTNVMDLRTQREMPGELTIEEIHKLEQQDKAVVEETGRNFRFEESKISGITYFGIDFMPAMSWMAGKELGRVVLIFLFMFFMAFVAIVFVSRQLYKPIGRLVKSFSDNDKVYGDASALRDEVEYIYQHVSDIRDQNQDLVNMMKAIEEKSQKHLGYAILMGDYREDTLNQEIVSLGLDWLNDRNYIVGFELREEVIPEAVNEMRDIYNKINCILQQELEKEYKVMAVTELASNFYFIVHCEKEEQLCTVLNRIITLIDAAFSIPVIFYVSKESEKAMTLSYSFLTLTQIGEAKNAFPLKSVYTFQELPVYFKE